MANLASIFCKQSRWEEAEDLLLKALEIGKSVLRKDNPETMNAMYYLAFTYYHKGNRHSAISTMQKVVGVRSRLFGLEHDDTMNAKKWLQTMINSTITRVSQIYPFYINFEGKNLILV